MKIQFMGLRSENYIYTIICILTVYLDTVLTKTTSYLIDEKIKKQFLLEQDCDIFTFFTLLFYIIKGGTYSNNHLNISHPMHRGALTSIDPLEHHSSAEIYDIRTFLSISSLI